MGAVVLDDSVVGERALVGTNSLVTEGTEIPPNTLAADVYTDLAERHGATAETLYEQWPPEDE